MNGRPYRWQAEAVETWSREHRGIVSVVTGAGKTVLALLCMAHLKRQRPDCRFVIAVPTVALLDQWRISVEERLGVPASHITALGGNRTGPIGDGTEVIIGVLNSLRALNTDALGVPVCLIVDECHRAASEANRVILTRKYIATLGLSATPEREYDDWTSTYLEPSLGPIVYRYSHQDALREGVIVPFELWNVRVPLSHEEQVEIARVSQRVRQERARLAKVGVADSVKLLRLLQLRSRLSQLAPSRTTAAVALVEHFRGQRGIVFHESITSANAIRERLRTLGHRVRTYHSAMGGPTRYEALRLFAVGQIDVLVTCRALDEGLDVPAATYGVLAASTRSHRQRIQRLGRVLRPASGKRSATVVTLYALPVEAAQLRTEADTLEGVAQIRWFGAAPA